MVSQVSLSASMRKNLLSLQYTQKLFDMTQERLSTGKKVNSALDGPSAYFTAQALNTRASEMEYLLDSMGQAVQTLKQADNGLTTLTGFIEQAKVLANQARDTSNTATYIPGTTNVDGLGSPQQLGNVFTGNTFNIRLGNAGEIVGTRNAPMTMTLASAGMDPAASACLAIRVSGNDFVRIKITAGMTSAVTLEDLTKRINGNPALNSLIVASIEDGHFTLKTLDASDSIAVMDLDTTVVPPVVLASGGVCDTLGLDRGKTVTISNVNNATLIGSKSGMTAGTTLSSMGVAPTPATVKINVGPYDYDIAIPSGGTTVTTFIAQLNAIPNMSAVLSADGELVLGCTQPGWAFKVTDLEEGNVARKLGIQTSNFINPSIGNIDSLLRSIAAVDQSMTAVVTRDGNIQISMLNGEDIIIFDTSGTASQSLGIERTSTNGANIRKGYSLQYDQVLRQIDQLILNNDTGYRGINLLNGDDLNVFFNETRTSILKINGVVFDTKGLGLKDAVDYWETQADIQISINQIDNAEVLSKSQQSVLGQNLATIQMREAFSENLVNILVTGADNLTLADMDEEAANMLALQVRQQLGVNALSLASQAQQAVLQLF